MIIPGNKNRLYRLLCDEVEQIVETSSTLPNQIVMSLLLRSQRSAHILPGIVLVT